MSLSILIVEDEPIIADDLSFTLEDFGYTVFGIVDSYNETLKILENGKPDMAIVDITLRNQKNGIEVASEILNKHKIPFIFLTSHFDSQTVKKSQIANPLGYAVKPFKEADLKVALQLSWMKREISESKPSQPKQIFVRKSTHIIPLQPHDILYAEANDNYTLIYTQNAKHTVTQTLKNIEAELLQSGFVRIHKSFLINISKIEMIEHSVVFINGKALPIGKSYKKSFLEAITVF